MQGKVNPLIAAAIAGVLIVILVIALVARKNSSVGAMSVSPTSSNAYTHPSPGSHP